MTQLRNINTGVITNSRDPFTYKGIKYPRGWLDAMSVKKLRDLGFEPYTAPPEPPKVLDSYDVDAERDKRLQAGFTFDIRGTTYGFQTDEVSMKRIAGAATLAGFAMGAGAKPGNFKWTGGATNFAWITAENSMVEMDAFETFAVGQRAARHETKHIFIAHYLKSIPTIPEDFADDKYWT